MTILSNRMLNDDAAKRAPVKSCKPTDDFAAIAPAIGFPSSKPDPTGINSIPRRKPMRPGSGDNATAIFGDRDVIAPEQKPQSTMKTMIPALLWTATQEKARIVVVRTHTLSTLNTPA